MDRYWPQTSLTNILINNPDYLKSQRHSHCPSPGTYLCQSHPHMRTTHSPGHAFFCLWYLTRVILQPGTLSPLVFFFHFSTQRSLHEETFPNDCPPRLDLDVYPWTFLPLPQVPTTCHYILIITWKVHIIGD